MNGKGDVRLPLVSVGIPNWNRKEELRITLTKVLESNYPALENIVVDNGSNDGSAEMVKSEFPCVKLYELRRNMGIGARNITLFEASGKYILTYDNDSEPATSSTIGEIVSFVERHADVAALCTNVINYHTGKSETYGWEKYATAYGGEYYEGLFVHGAGMAFRSKCIQQTRGFPEDFFLYFEEADLTLQLVNKGLKIVYKPDIVTYHRRSPVQRDEALEFLLKTRNGIWLFWKYFPFSLALCLTLGYVFKQGVLTAGRPAYLLSFFKGTYLGLRGISAQRKKGEPLSREAINKTKRWQRQNLALPSAGRIMDFLKQQLSR